MSAININAGAANSVATPTMGRPTTLPQQSPAIATSGASDSEIVAKVANTVIKPSGVNEAAQPTREVVEKAAQEIQQFVQKMGRNLNFSIDETTGYHVVRVVNPDTGELIRQLPSEELLKIARDFERLNNVLVSQRA
jgi:flagellar protein FlaG